MDEELKMEFFDKSEKVDNEDDKVATDLNIKSKGTKQEKTAHKNNELHAQMAKRDINVSSSLVWGVIGFAVFYGTFPYLIFEIFNLNYFIDLFRNRGSVPYVTTFIFFWAVAILVLKIKKISREKCQNNVAELELKNCNKDDILQRIKELRRSDETKESTLISLIHNTFIRIDSIGKIENISETLEQQVNIEITRLESSYSLVKTIIWAIPVLGFIGTVIGISAATGGFVELLQGASDFAEMKKPLQDVASGLAKAFETTLLALFWSVIIMFFSTFVEKREENLVTDIEEYSIDYLHNKLQSDTKKPVDTDRKLLNWQEVIKIFDKILDSKVLKWQNSFEQNVVDKSDSVKDYLESWLEGQKKLFTQLQENLDKNVVGISAVVESQKNLIQGVDDRWNEVASQTDNTAKEIDNRSEKQDEQFAIWHDNFNKSVEMVVETLNGLPVKLNETFKQVNGNFDDIAKSLNTLPGKLVDYTNTIQESIELINKAILAKEAVLEISKNVKKKPKDE